MTLQLITTSILIFAIIIVIYRLVNLNSLEGMDASVMNSEAIANIASLYNKDELTVTNANITGKLNILPKGIIVAWTGTTAPKGWALCDGQNGTPDLRGRFIYGFGARKGATINAKGGAETVTLTATQMPVHSHRISPMGSNKGWPKHKSVIQGTDQDRRGNHKYNVGNQRTWDEGGGQAHENMPPYYVLAYIMRL